jgi:hemerythrin superfamily protein
MIVANHRHTGSPIMKALANRVTPSITTMIRMDHSHVLALFHRYRPDSSASRKRALVTNACLALEVHAQLEEEIFYPALRSTMSEDPIFQKSEPEHAEMRRLIGELRERAADATVGDLPYDDKFLELMRIVIHHVADEETTLLPMAERLLGIEMLSQLGAQMTRRRVELIKPHAGEFVVTTARSFPVGAAAGAALLTAGAIAIGAALAPKRRRAVRRARANR